VSEYVIEFMEQGTKAGAAKRWVDAVNADGSYGRWAYAMVRQVSEVNEAVTKAGGVSIDRNK